MTALERAWEGLNSKKKGGFPEGYPSNVRRLYSPVDRVHDALTSCIGAAERSLASAMFGWDDQEINTLFHKAFEQKHLPVQLSLDASQSGSPHEVPLIKAWGTEVGNSVSIGHSDKGAITHLKTFVIDGVLTIGGSTNLSHGGQFDQDNEIILVWDSVFAAEARARLDIVHDSQLMQMQKRQNKLLIDYAAKKTHLSLEERHKLEAGILP